MRKTITLILLVALFATTRLSMVSANTANPFSRKGETQTTSKSFYDTSLKMRFKILDEDNATVAITYRTQEDVMGNELAYTGEVTLPNTVEHEGKTYTLVAIGDSTFYNAKELKSITFNEALTSIGNFAFNNCPALTSEIKLQGKITSIGYKAFYSCNKIPSLTIGKQVEEIKDGAFSRMYAPVTMEEGNTRFTLANGILTDTKESRIIAVNYKTTSLVIPNETKRIGDYALENCSKLSTITLNEGLETIGYRAFNYCKSLSSIKIPSSVTAIARNVFYNCKGLASISVAEGNTKYKVENNYLLSRDGKSVVFYAIGSKATSSEVPEGVEVLQEGAFSASTLSTISLPSSLKEIEETVFLQCRKLESIEVPDHTEKIGRAAFAFCSGLKKITIGSGIKNIDRICFAYTPFTELYIKATTPPEVNQRLSSCFAKKSLDEGILYVPSGCKESYAESEGFKDFKTIKEYNLKSDSGIKLKTNKAVGDKIKLTVKYDGELTINGLDVVPQSNVETECTLTAQEIAIKGNVLELHCAGNELTELSLMGCNMLETLDCSTNQIASLDLKELPNLSILLCSENSLNTLDTSKNLKLAKLWCSKNSGIKSLDLTKNSELIALWCYGCSLQTLDLSPCTSLTGVDCYSNQLTSISFGKLDYLTRINCSNNQLETLDLSGIANLDELNCSKNKLTSLNLASVPYLTLLNCASNLFTSLDVSPVHNLASLYCQQNQLEALNLSKNKVLEVLYCYENRIAEKAMGDLVSSLRKVPQDHYENLMIINTSASEEKNYPTAAHIAIAKEKGWTPKDFQNGIDDGNGIPFGGYNATTKVLQEDTLRIYSTSEGTLLIEGKPMQELLIFSLEGELLFQAAPSSSGRYTVSLPLHTGTIIVALGNYRQKVVLK